MIGPSIHKILTNARDVYTLVDDRVHFGARPQDSRLPCIVLTQVSTVTPRVFKGSAGFEQGRVQADVLASTYGSAKELAVAVRKTLDGYTGVGSTPSYSIHWLRVEDERDVPLQAQSGRSSPMFGVSLDITYQSQDDA